MAENIFVCPLCRQSKSGVMFHCRDHCMDMCSDHVRETGQGAFVCKVCQKLVQKLVFSGGEWVEA